VEQLGAGSGTEDVEALPKATLEFIWSDNRRLAVTTDHL
jgi:hypothetical protein